LVFQNNYIYESDTMILTIYGGINEIDENIQVVLPGEGGKIEI